MWTLEELRAVNLVKCHDIRHYFAGKVGKLLELEGLNAVECISYISGLFATAGVYNEKVEHMRVLHIKMDPEKRKFVGSVLKNLNVEFTVTGDRLDVGNSSENLIRFHRYILPLDDMGKLTIASPYHMEAVRYERTKRSAPSRRRSTTSVA